MTPEFPLPGTVVPTLLPYQIEKPPNLTRFRDFFLINPSNSADHRDSSKGRKWVKMAVYS